MVRGSTLNQSHKLRTAELRVNFAQQVNVVGHHFDLQHVASRFFGQSVNQFFKPLGHLFRKHFAPVFGALAGSMPRLGLLPTLVPMPHPTLYETHAI